MSSVFCIAATPSGSRSSSGRRRRLPTKKPLWRRRRRAGGWKERAVALRGSLGRDAAMAGKQRETVRLARYREGEQSSNNAVGRRGSRECGERRGWVVRDRAAPSGTPPMVVGQERRSCWGRRSKETIKQNTTIQLTKTLSIKKTT
ncbi:hypothetical protein BHM03_00057058 [Ensete ventricosum]|nr:hypothetical protein BHM03_00057058 [Ensete ventricosum]